MATDDLDLIARADPEGRARIHFGVGVLDAIGSILETLGLERVLVVTTAGRAASDDGRRLVDCLGPRVAAVYVGVRSHVPTGTVDEALAAARGAGADGLVSFGGGSCADTAKAVALAVLGEGMSLPHVTVPTTYSGAELTPFFGTIDEVARRKTGAGSPALAPVAAVYDPVLTLGTPPRVSAETGMNALAHGVESAYATDRTPATEGVALACVERVAAWLPAVVEYPTGLAPRALMLGAAALGGWALGHTAMGAHHGLAQLVGGRTGISHGLANAVLLTHALAFNLPAVGEAATRIGAALGDPADPAGAVDRLRARLGLPGSLSACGIAEEELDVIADMAVGHRTVAGNPRPVTRDDARAILAAAW